jgi:archaellum component FlaC
MDQRQSKVGEDIENTRAVMAEKIDMIEDRVNQTMDGTKSTIDNVMHKVKDVQGTIEEAKSTVDNLLDTIKQTMEETMERVKSTASLIEQVDQNPWIMFGSAILTGYILSSFNRDTALSQTYAHEQKREM